MKQEDIEREIAWTRSLVLADAAWRRVCQVAKMNPKDPQLADVREVFMRSVQGAMLVLTDAGFEGLEEWLEMEERLG